MERKLRKFPVLAVYLFGSRAQNKARKDSDIDVAVVVEDKNKVDPRQLLEILGQQFPLSQLDLSVVDLQTTSPLFLYQIIKNGKLLYEKQKGVHQQLCPRIMRLYFDDQYRLQIFKKGLDKRLEEGSYGY